jgi:2-keto-3-deoxy-L-rhamnonate aldolase RhmA
MTASAPNLAGHGTREVRAAGPAVADEGAVADDEAVEAVEAIEAIEAIEGVDAVAGGTGAVGMAVIGGQLPAVSVRARAVSAAIC